MNDQASKQAGKKTKKTIKTFSWNSTHNMDQEHIKAIYYRSNIKNPKFSLNSFINIQC